MKPKTPGNLRDFRIDERSHEPEPRQSVRARQNPSMQEWSVNDSAGATHDSLWSTWEREAGGSSVDLAQSVPAPMTHAPARVPTTMSPAADSAESDSGPLQGRARTDAARGALPWSSELAVEERRMERQGTVDYTNQYQKQEILRSRTREFTAQLQNLFREHVELFNESRHSPAHHIHVYRVSKTDEDFMLFRNGVKLVVSGGRAGRVVFAFNQYLGQIFAPTQAPVIELEATWGPFDQLFWGFKSERVQAIDVVRYFLTEFCRQSFR